MSPIHGFGHRFSVDLVRERSARDILIDMTHAEVEDSSGNMFGQVNSGTLQIRPKLGLTGLEKRRHALQALGREIEPVDFVIYLYVTTASGKWLKLSWRSQS
jgi:hypothetical protein